MDLRPVTHSLYSDDKEEHQEGRFSHAGFNLLSSSVLLLHPFPSPAQMKDLTSSVSLLKQEPRV